jgi:hypothetical protein
MEVGQPRGAGSSQLTRMYQAVSRHQRSLAIPETLTPAALFPGVVASSADQKVCGRGNHAASGAACAVCLQLQVHACVMSMICNHAWMATRSRFDLVWLASLVLPAWLD